MAPLAATLVCAALCALASAQAAPPDTNNLPVITVIGLTPYGDAAQPAADATAAVQTATAAQLDRSHAADLAGFLARRLGGVSVNDIQNNPLQPDISYRGYTASPLLGTPQGLSVYVDGMRVNQPFGDVVSWDLIPHAAISRIELVSGSSPLFGVNSLGGSLSVHTKDGYSAPGTTALLTTGSHGRQTIEAETGGHSDAGLNWYLTANRFRDAGWRVESPSDARQVFGKLGWRDSLTDVSLSAAGADTNLNGNGLQDVRLLAKDYASVYTKPDNTGNHAAVLNLTASHGLGDGVALSGNAWYRNIRSATYNGDINDAALGQSLDPPTPAEQAALAAGSVSGYPGGAETPADTPFPRWRCIANALLNTAPNTACNGLINRTALSQHNAGAALQLRLERAIAGHANRLIAGAVYDASSVHFVQSSQFAYLTPDHGVIGVSGPGAYADGTQSAENAFDARVDLGGRTRTYSVFLADSLTLTDALHLNLAARYDQARVSNHDALTPGGGPGSLDGEYRYSRVNPSLGLLLKASPDTSFYGSYGESSRAPSSIELGCADPANPCRLPNAMAGDPALAQVVTKTFELGARGQSLAGFNWNASVFRAENHDDILFVAANQAGFGYFRNFGKTRRQGLELGASKQTGAVTLGTNYTLLDATYRSSERLVGSSNSSSDAVAPGFDGTIQVETGNRIPLVPRQLLKAFAQWDVSAQLALDLDVLLSSSAYARGNENNQHQSDGVYYLGPGSTGGYAVLNLGAEWQPTEALTAFVQINNLLDRRYATAAQLGTSAFNAEGKFVAQPFAGPVIDGERPLLHTTLVAPGAPRAVLFGLRYRIGP